jgi:HD-GYP domain-containing protein (c-di-GMP phosphodiesterase class II)
MEPEPAAPMIVMILSKLPLQIGYDLHPQHPSTPAFRRNLRNVDTSHHIFFLQHLGDLCRKEPINAANDIFDASNKTRLAYKDGRITPELLRKIAKATLKAPLAADIQFSAPLSTPALKLQMQRSLTRSPSISLLLQATKKQHVALDYLNRLSLPLPMVNLLTIMWRQLPSLFEHSLDVALISTCISLLCGRLVDPAHLMYAGLFHDVGSMYLNPELLDSERPLTWAEWSQIYTHPAVGNEVLQAFHGVYLHSGILSAVLQHHERIDGSGYPNGLSDSRLGDTGRILALAEVSASVTRHKSKDYLVTVLNANSGKLDDDLLELLHRILANVSGDEFIAASMRAATFKLIDSVTDAVARWHQLPLEVTAHSALSKVQSGIAAVEKILWRSGFSTDQLSAMDDSLEMDVSSEVAGILMEAHYQLGQVLHDVYRNKAKYMALKPKEASIAFGRWIAETQRRLNEIEEEKKTSAAAAEAEAAGALQTTEGAEAHVPQGAVLSSGGGLSEIQWYYLKGGKKHGPHSNVEVLEKVQNGELRMSDLIWYVGFSYWRTIQDAAELLYSDEGKQILEEEQDEKDD